MEAGAVAAIITDNDAENDEMYVAMQGRMDFWVAEMSWDILALLIIE